MQGFGGPGASPPPESQPPAAEGPSLGIEGITNAAEIGRGGFGVVYRAQQPDFNRTVAVKVLGTHLDEASRQRFQREIQAMGALSGHPNIVNVYHAGFTGGGNPYIVMEYESRGSLAERIKGRGPLRWQDAIAVGVKMSGALEAAHKAGVLHRDVKPENILVSGYGEPKLCDFGIARLEGGMETRTGLITASVPHAAPEILTGQRPSVASDVYALGSTIYTLMLGRPAFVADTDESIVPLITRISTHPVPNLRPLGVPDPVCRALERALAKQPGDRQPAAALFGRELQGAQGALGLPVTDLVLETGDREASGPQAGGVLSAPVAPAGAASGGFPTEATPAGLQQPPTGFGPSGPPAPPAGLPPTEAYPHGPAPGAPGGPAPPRGSRARLYAILAGVGVLVVGGAVALILVLARGGGGTSNPTPTPTATPTPTGTPTPVKLDLTNALLRTSDFKAGIVTNEGSAQQSLSGFACAPDSFPNRTDQQSVQFQGQQQFADRTLTNYALSFRSAQDAQAFFNAAKTKAQTCGGNTTFPQPPTAGDQAFRYQFNNNAGGVTDVISVRKGAGVEFLVVGTDKAGDQLTQDDVQGFSNTLAARLADAGA